MQYQGSLCNLKSLLSLSVCFFIDIQSIFTMGSKTQWHLGWERKRSFHHEKVDFNH